jgi:Skp family chaperone for outer membrane proteins
MRTALPILFLAFVTLATTAGAQETIDQFNAANAENRRHSATQGQLRNDALQLHQDQGRGLLNCQGAGSAGAIGACQGNVQIQTQQRGLMLDNRIQQERNAHRQNLKGIGVSPLQ